MLDPRDHRRRAAERGCRTRASPGRSLASLLLDQRFVAGLGNYLRSDILFAAGLTPDARPRDLDTAQRTRLAKAMLRLARQSYRTGGVTNDPARARASARAGVAYEDYRFLVYGREGAPCWSCGTRIARHDAGGRGLYRCAKCQPAPSGRVSEGAIQGSIMQPIMECMVKVRKGQAPAQHSSGTNSAGDLSRCSTIPPIASDPATVGAHRGGRVGRLPGRAQGAGDAQGGPRLRRPVVRPVGRVVRDARSDCAARSGVQKLRARARACWSWPAPPATTARCPGEISKTFRLTRLMREEIAAARMDADVLDLSLLTSEPALPHLPVQGLRVDRHAAVPLAVQLLSQSRAAPDQRLDGRDLRALGAPRTASSS